jgi:hypothetical protein
MTTTQLHVDDSLTARLPGRAERRQVGALAQLLFETARRHGAFEAADWSDWYAAFTDAREHGRTPEEAARIVGASTLARAVAA